MVYLLAFLASLALFAGLMVWAGKNVNCNNRAFVGAILAIFAVFAFCNCVPAFAADMIPAHETVPASVDSAATAIAITKVFLKETVLPIISTLALALFTMLMNYLAKKYKIQTLSDQNGYLFKLAGQGIALAEERAAKLAGGINKLTGSQKLDIAVGHVLKFFPAVSHEQAQDIVHSVLAQIPGAGATGEAVTLLPQEGGYSIPVPAADEVELVPVAGPQGPMGPQGPQGPMGPAGAGA